jgi:hypothetical protein
MGVKDEANALNHDKYTDTNAVEAVAAGADYIINSGADTMTGDLTIDKATPSLLLQDTTAGSGSSAFIKFLDATPSDRAVISKGTDDLLTIDALGGVQLLYNSGARLTVDDAGVDVAGTLDATGVITGTKLMTADGTALLPTHSWTDDLNTGMYSSGADEIGFTAAGVQRMTISSTAVSINNLTNGGAGCPLVNTDINGKLTCGTAAPFSDTKCFYVETPQTNDTFSSIWRPFNKATITEFWCQTDAGTVGGVNIQIDDTSLANVLNPTLTCDTGAGETASTSATPSSTIENNVFNASGTNDTLNLLLGTVSATATRLSVCWTYTYE